MTVRQRLGRLLCFFGFHRMRISRNERHWWCPWFVNALWACDRCDHAEWYWYKWARKTFRNAICCEEVFEEKHPEEAKRYRALRAERGWP